MTDIKAVEFEAEVRPGKQMADGTINLVFNVPEYLRPQAFEVMDHHLAMARVVVVFGDKSDD